MCGIMVNDDWERKLMKKSDIIDLIRYHSENNENGFRSVAYLIAEEFDRSGDTDLAKYIMSLLSVSNTFVPQASNIETPYLQKVDTSGGMLLIPDSITNDIRGILNAVKHNIGINKFIFTGAPGTGKTEAAKQLANLLGRELYMVDSASLIDSKLGQTQKNIALLFKTINTITSPRKVMILFDELDAVALDRSNPNDIREMGRATTAVLKGLDELNPGIVVVATTNMFNEFDKALIRRFDFVVDFNRYSKEDLLQIAEKMLDKFLTKVSLAKRDVRLFRKIMCLYERLPCPGELQNLIRTSVAFSDPDDGCDYFRRLYNNIVGGQLKTGKELQSLGFTVREIGFLQSKSKSGVARELKGEDVHA